MHTPFALAVLVFIMGFGATLPRALMSLCSRGRVAKTAAGFPVRRAGCSYGLVNSLSPQRTAVNASRQQRPTRTE
jgi:hypothetical protein